MDPRVWDQEYHTNLGGRGEIFRIESQEEGNEWARLRRLQVLADY